MGKWKVWLVLALSILGGLSSGQSLAAMVGIPQTRQLGQSQLVKSAAAMDAMFINKRADTKRPR